MSDGISQDDARRKAEDYLAERQANLELVIVDVREFPVGWVFFYDSKIHQETRSISHALPEMRRSSWIGPTDHFTQQVQGDPLRSTSSGTR